MKVKKTNELVLLFFSDNMKILIIEDNENIAQNIQKFLALEDIDSQIVTNGQEWLELAKQKHFDAMVLDIMLPGKDGIQICSELKKIKDIPIIMTTAKWQLEDKLKWFDVGADDYLTKPFDLEELLARLKALLQRNPQTKIYKKWNIIIDIASKKVLKNDEEIILTTKEFVLLEILLKNSGTILSRSDIIEKMRWEDALRDGDNKLDVYISILRKKLDKKLIITAKGYGYKIEK